MTSQEILEELAAQNDEIREFSGATFEGLEDYWAIADARLSAFSSDQMWAVAIEAVGINRAEKHSLRVWIFGNCLQLEDEFCALEKTILTVPNAWNKEIEKNQIWGIARDGFAFRWRGRKFDFAPALDDLGAAGIELSRREIESGLLSPQQMLRFVCEKLDHPFFLGEDALRDLLNQRAIPFKWKYDPATQRSWYQNELGEFEEEPLLSTYLELVLQTRDWIHPKLGLADGEEGEWEISPHEAFEVLAQTLATRDLAAWNAQDATKFNSHWRNWADIEADKERLQTEQIAAGKAAFRASIEKISREKRAQFLAGIYAAISQAPSISEWSQQDFIQFGDGEIRIFHELLPEVDAILAELKTALNSSQNT